MKIDKHKLIKAVSAVNGAGFHGKIAIKLDGEFALMVLGFNGELQIQSWCKILEGEGFPFVVLGSKFLEILKLLEGDEISLEIEENRLKVLNKMQNYFLNIEKIEDYISHDKELDGGVQVLLDGELLKDAIEKLNFCTSTEEHRYYLQGIYWENKDGCLKLVASDGRRLGFWENPSKIEAKDFNKIIPSSSMAELVKIISAGDTVQVLVFDRKVVFNTGKIILISSIIDGDFPDYRSVLLKDPKSIILSKKKLETAINKVLPFLDSKNVLLEVRITGNMCFLESKNPNYGEAKTFFELAESSETGINFGVNYKFLHEAIKKIDGVSIELFFEDSIKPMKFQEFSSVPVNYFYIIMPMKLGQ